MSSTTPSAKYSCSESELRLAKGRTAIEGFIGEGEGRFQLFHRITGDFRTWGTLPFPHRTDETEALAGQGFDEALFVPGIADCAAGDIQTGRQRPVGNDTAVPNGVDEVVFTDDAVPVTD